MTTRTSTKFDRVRYPKVIYAGMLEYDGDLHIPKHYLVNPPEITNTMGEYLANTGVTSTCDVRDAEIRPRHLLLERQQVRQV